MTDNELIALFMDWTFVKGKNLVQDHYEKGHDWMDISQIKYHESWDWLMPVVDRIHNVAPIDVQEINNEGLLIFEFGGICIPIKEVYGAVVDFIKWHNSQNPGK